MSQASLKVAMCLLLLSGVSFFVRAQEYTQVYTSDSTQTFVAADTLKCDSLLFAKKPILAVSTNALFDLAITPNFAIEFPIGKHWSVFGEYTFPWWVTKANDRAWQVLKWDLGVRYWFRGNRSQYPMDVLRGHFVGLDLSAGYYDIEPHHKGWQGEFAIAALEYGYAWRLSDAWRLDAFIDFGWIGTSFRYYEATEGDEHLLFKEAKNRSWILPTKLGVSFKYIIGRKPKNERRVKK
jgi:hypothetical protein